MDWVGVGVLVTAFVGLVPLLIWHLERRQRNDERGFSIEDADWVTRRGLDYEEFLGLLLGLDYSSLPNLTGETSGDAVTKAPIFSKSRDSWSLVIADGRHIAGYWSCFSMSAAAAVRIRSGIWKDSEMHADGVRSLSEPGPHDLYFEMFGIHKGYSENRSTIRKLLLRSLSDFANKLKETKTEVRAILANGFTKQGEELCRSLGMHPIAESIQGGLVFETTDIEGLSKRLLKYAGRSAPSRQVLPR